MKRRAFFYLSLFLCLTSLLLCRPTPAFCGMEGPDVLSLLISKIPSRPAAAMTGSEFARYVAGMDKAQREEAIVTELLQGNMPDALRRLKPLHLLYRTQNGKPVRATFFTMPDYLAIGSDRDALLIPMNLRSALTVALKFGFTLPTKKIVNVIFNQSDRYLTPEPLPACPEMSSTGYYVRHNSKVCEQRRLLDVAPDALVSGHKKDIVLTNRLVHNTARIAIYGWQYPSGRPIQPLSLAHNASYADYSHGVRLVSDTVLVDNKQLSIYQVLQDRLLAGMLSDEGPMPALVRLLLRSPVSTYASWQASAFPEQRLSSPEPP